MQKRLLGQKFALRSLAVALNHDAPLAAQPLIRETPTTLVVPIPGTGVPGGVPGGGAFGTVLPATLSQTGAINQIVALAQAGYLDVNSVPAPATLPTLVNAADTTQPLELRVRSHLDVNCAQCHRPGIGAAGVFEFLTNVGPFDARAGTPLSLAGIVNGSLGSSLNDPAHRVLVPGSTTFSQLLARIATRGPTRMPPLASSERDFSGFVSKE